MLEFAISVLLLFPLDTGGVGGLNLEQLCKADVAIVGRVISEEPSVRIVAMHEGDNESSRACGVYSVAVDAVIKGTATGTVTVLAGSAKDASGWLGKNGADVARLFSLPVGKRIVLFLQMPRDGKFNREPTASPMMAKRSPKGNVAGATVIRGAQAQASGAAAMPGKMRSICGRVRNSRTIWRLSRGKTAASIHLPIMAMVKNLPLGMRAVCSRARRLDPYSMK